MVQFICPECDSPLDGADDTMVPTTCPHCGIQLSVNPPDGVSSPPSDPHWSQPSPDTPRPARFVVEGSYLRIHRSVAYSQAILLAVVALISFVLGAGFGGLYSGDSEPRTAANLPCEIQGTVTRIRPDGEETGVDDVVVVFVPADRRPDERLPILGLRPDEELPPSDDSTLLGIRLLGGAYAKTDPQGRYSARVASAGDFYVLVLAKSIRRDGAARWNKRDLAQIGRYFENVMELLGGREYRWQKLTVTPGERWDVAFRPTER